MFAWKKTALDRLQQPFRCVLRKMCSKIYNKFTGEHPCRSAILIMLLCNFIEITVCGRQPLQNLKWYVLLKQTLLGPFLNTLPHMIFDQSNFFRNSNNPEFWERALLEKFSSPYLCNKKYFFAHFFAINFKISLRV